MLYGIGASYNPGMSRYNRTFQRGLAGIKGLNFAYRLNTWGPKVGPPLLPANLTGLRGLSGPITWIEGILGLESAANVLNDAQTIVSGDLNAMPSLLSIIQGYLTQAQSYSGNSQSTIVNQAQAAASEATGLAGVLQNLQTSGGTLLANIVTAQAEAATSDVADPLKVQAQAFDDQYQTLVKNVNQLGKDTAALLKAAGAAPGVVAAIENTVSSSISTLTWIIGGSLAAYFLLPSFIPKLAGSLRKASHAN